MRDKRCPVVIAASPRFVRGVDSHIAMCQKNIPAPAPENTRLGDFSSILAAVSGVLGASHRVEAGTTALSAHVGVCGAGGVAGVANAAEGCFRDSGTKVARTTMPSSSDCGTAALHTGNLSRSVLIAAAAPERPTAMHAGAEASERGRRRRVSALFPATRRRPCWPRTVPR